MRLNLIRLIVAAVSLATFAADVRAGAAGPTLTDAGLSVTKVVGNLEGPTGIAFLPGHDDAFVINKESGKVQFVNNFSVRAGSVLDLKVATDSEEGLLGIALHPKFNTNKFVYLYYTSADRDGGDAIEHRIDRFKWNGTALKLDRRIKTLPATPGPNHDGGKLTFGPDGKLYAVIGDLNRNARTNNFEDDSSVDRAAVILRLNADGSPPKDNPFFQSGKARAQNDIFAYGVRNSFGMTFDPKTNLMWDTENGPEEYDEINVVKPGFNSGWEDIMGPKARVGGSTKDLVKLGRKAYYADPKFSWKTPVAPTDLTFNNSGDRNPLPGAYAGDLFVGDFYGGLLHFDLSATRRHFVLSGDLADTVLDDSDNASAVKLGDNFGAITDLVARADGLYVLSAGEFFSTGQGALYRITSSTAGDAGLSAGAKLVPEPAGLGALILAGALLRRRRQRLPLV